MEEQLHSGEIYDPYAQDVMEVQLRCLDKLYDFNHTRPTELRRRDAMLREMFCEIGEGCYIEPPLHANWGGRFVHFGKGVYANFALTLVDDTHIYVGDHTLFGPNVIAVGNPCRVLRPIGERDREYYYHDLKIPPELLAKRFG